MQKNVLAFDFGASSGRAIVGKYYHGKLELEEVHRFPNYPVEEEGGLYWDIDYLFQQVIKGIEVATSNYPIDSLGIDTWGVDFGLLDKEGQLLKRPRNYRDPRTKDILAKVNPILPLEEIYQQTGNQLMEINTLFQLLAIKWQDPELFKKADQLLMMPDLLNYLLTDKKVAERSIASTAQFVNPHSKEWDETLLHTFDLLKKLFPTLVETGNSLGYIKPSLGLPKIKVFNICEHDTASAVVSVPSNQRFLFVSCGTWSLVGTELPAPIINNKAFHYNLTNESGINGSARFLKNCTGLWIIQEVKRNFEALGRTYSFAEMTDQANQARPFQCLIDTDDAVFVAPGNMIRRIQEYAKETQQSIPETDGEIARCVYESLAMKYKYTFLEITDAVGAEFDTVNIVGGGSQAAILCQMVADASNMRVCAGPVEATAIGNVAVQLMAQGVFEDLTAVREWVKEVAEVKYYYPTLNNREWDRQFSRYQKIMNMKK